MKLIKPTQINEYQESKADRIIETVFFVGLSLILLILSVLILATTSKAANDDEFSYYNLPYYVDYFKGSFFPSDFPSFAQLPSGSTDDFYWVSEGEVLNNRYPTIYFYISNANNVRIDGLYKNDMSTIVSYDDFDFRTDFVKVSFATNPSYVRYYYNNGSWHLQGTGNRNVGSVYMLGRTSSNKNIYGFTYNVPFLLTEDIYYNSDLIFTNGAPIIPGPDVNTGHAIEPDFDPDNNVTDDGTATQPNDPQFPQFIPPTIDTSTLETLVESLIDFVKEFADFVGECFSTFFAWLVEVIKNAIQSIINTIYDAVTFIYNNLVSLFEPTFENIGHAVEPVQEEEVITVFESTDLYALYSDFTSFTTTFDNAFDITEPDSFTITIHVEDITILNQTQPYVLNLGSQFYPIRSALRTFLWILVSFGAVFLVEKNLSSWLKGSGEEK